MADEYVGMIGFVAFDVRNRNLPNGAAVRDIAIRKLDDPDKLVNVTLWPEHETLEVKKGDLVAVYGKHNTRKYQTQSGENRTGHSINAYNLAILGGHQRAPRETEQKGTEEEGIF